MAKNSSRVIIWWALVLIGASVTLLVAWADRVVHVAPVTLLTVGAVVIALSWLIALVTVPWNLYFAARRAAKEMAVSRERGITTAPAHHAEAGQISRRMLWSALGAHVGTAGAAAVIAYWSGNKTGYYIAGIFLLSTAFRPASAYFLHMRERIGTLTRESTHPRDDVVMLRTEMGEIKLSLSNLRAEAVQTSDGLRRTEATLSDTIAHTRNLLVDDLGRLQASQEADRRQASSGTDDLKRQLDQIARRVEATLEGIGDHQELLAGLRALVRMVRSEPA